MAQTEYVDELVKEYLLFRGFSTTWKTLNTELRSDKTSRADKIIELLGTFVNGHDLNALKDFWSKIDAAMFSKLDYNYMSSVKKFETGILKLYLIIAHSNNKTDKIQEFFMGFKTEISSQYEWKDWFYFPFCKNPEEVGTFSFYFTKQWQETFWISLRNFLTTIFQCMPAATLSKIDQDSSRNKFQDANRNAQTRNPRPNSISQATLNDIQPFDVTPPGPIVDDFYIIAAEIENLSNLADNQSRGIKSFIKTIGSSNSPVFGRKDT